MPRLTCPPERPPAVPLAIALVVLLTAGCDGTGEPGRSDDVAGTAGAIGSGDESDPGAALVARLAVEPALPRPEIPPGTAIVLVEIGVEGNIVSIPEPPMLQPGATLRLQRALARGRTAPPDLWVVSASPDGSAVRYWCAANREAKVRASIHARGGEGAHGGLLVPAKAVGSVRIPFEPSGQVRIYRGTGGLVTTYRFGNGPEDPVTRVHR